MFRKNNSILIFITAVFMLYSTAVISEIKHPLAIYFEPSELMANKAEKRGYTIDSGITGTWYNSSQSGHGFMLESLGGGNLLLAWYTFDSYGDPIFVIGLGEMISNNTVRVNMKFVAGMVFGTFDPTNVVREDWGTVDMTFLNCNLADIVYNSTYTDRYGTTYGSGSFQVTRLTAIENLPCNFGNNVGISGSIKNARTNGAISGVDVEFTKGSSLDALESSNSSGSYAATSLSADTEYDILLTKTGYLIAKYNNAMTPSEGTLFLETIFMIDNNHAGNGNFSGTITDALTGNGVANATISFRNDMNTTSGSIVKTVTTNSSGGYSANSMGAGHYTGRVSSSGYNTSYFIATNVGSETNINQDATISPVLQAGETRVVLTWASDPEDLDSHMTGPTSNNSSSRFHVYYDNDGSLNSSPFTNLDLDARDGFGPETITITQQRQGTYRYSVHDYTNRHSTTSRELSNSTAQVKVYNNNTVHTFNVPNSAGNLWTVFELNGSDIIPVNQMSFEEDAEEITRSSHKKPTDADLIFQLPDK